MRSVRNCLSDPSLHLLATALILIYVALGNRSSKKDSWAEEPMFFCRKCQVHHYPDTPCARDFTRKVAAANP